VFRWRLRLRVSRHGRVPLVRIEEVSGLFKLPSWLRPLVRCMRLYWAPVVAAVTIEVLCLSVMLIGSTTTALAGDTYPFGGSAWSGNGDCWQAQTPVMCRNVWNGKDSTIHMRLIDQLNDTSLHNDAGTACTNWNNAPGPQYCSYSAGSNDTWTYLKIDDSIGAPNGITLNCANSGCPQPNNAGWILWSEIHVPHADHDQQYNGCTGTTQYWATQIFAHEIGHSYGLAHHGAACSNVTLMTQGDTFTAPTNIDIGPFPGCSGGPGTGGVRCIYQQT
jgi:reprolysin-like metallo-peptidase family M12B